MDLHPDFRSAGTYSKYSGIDDKIDDLHFYTTYIKFGIGRATMMLLKSLEMDIYQLKRKINQKYDENSQKIFLGNNEIFKF